MAKWPLKSYIRLTPGVLVLVNCDVSFQLIGSNFGIIFRTFELFETQLHHDDAVVALFAIFLSIFSLFVSFFISNSRTFNKKSLPADCWLWNIISCCWSIGCIWKYRRVFGRVARGQSYRILTIEKNLLWKMLNHQVIKIIKCLIAEKKCNFYRIESREDEMGLSPINP